MEREMIQKKSERARVAQSTIMSVIILEYSFISTSLSESMLAIKIKGWNCLYRMWINERSQVFGIILSLFVETVIHCLSAAEESIN